MAGAAAVQSGRAIAMAGQCIGCAVEDNAMLSAKGIFATSLKNFRVRHNDFLSFHGAVFLDTCDGLEIQYNLMRGLVQVAFNQLKNIAGAAGLSRDNINPFQAAGTAMFAAPQGSQFMGTGEFLISGFDVNISHNRIAAQAAIVGMLLIEASFEENEILAFIGILSLFGIIVRVASNLIAGLLLGYTQVGVIIDLVFESNFCLGFLGITLLPLADFISVAGSTLAGGMQKSGIASNGNAVLSSGQQTASTVGTLKTFGLAATVKICTNDFLTIFYGVARKAFVPLPSRQPCLRIRTSFSLLRKWWIRSRSSDCPASPFSSWIRATRHPSWQVAPQIEPATPSSRSQKIRRRNWPTKKWI